MARYKVTVRVGDVTSCAPRHFRDGLTARRSVHAPCAQAAACELAAPYVDAGLAVDWTVRRAGLRRLGRRWSGRFVPDDGDGLAGVREPRRPYPSAGSAGAVADVPAA